MEGVNVLILHVNYERKNEVSNKYQGTLEHYNDTEGNMSGVQNSCQSYGQSLYYMLDMFFFAEKALRSRSDMSLFLKLLTALKAALYYKGTVRLSHLCRIF